VRRICGYTRYRGESKKRYEGEKTVQMKKKEEEEVENQPL